MAKPHLASVSTAYYNTNYHNISANNYDGYKMHGSRRVITFCLLITVLPTILIVLPLYLRNIKYADVMYRISDSDVIQIHKGQSSIFCQKHTLQMNSSFSAFQMSGIPEISDKRKHLRIKKSMTLSEATLEYWGFYLLKGATVELKACSQYDHSKIVVVTGDRMLNTCKILEGYRHKKTPIIETQGLQVTVKKPEHTSDHMTSSKVFTNNIYKINYDLTGTSYKEVKRLKRNIKDIHNPNTILDTGVNHGGSALNSTFKPQPTMSSFERSLYECYHDKMLINNITFPKSLQCNSSDYLEKSVTLKVKHDISLDGYYYYIFYNDHGLDEIHSSFDIYKPTFQYLNNSESKVCINRTLCEFDIEFFSDELVIVEKPTREGLQNEESDSSILISVCHPRVSVYVFFPIAVLLLILLFAFL